MLTLRPVRCWSVLILSLALVAAAHAAQPGAPGTTRNLFHELLGQTDAAIDAKLATAWQQLFAGDPANESVYYPAADDTAYIADVGNGDVRTEGMSYGMMLAVQLDRQREFDALWKWAWIHMRHASGPREGYFAWQCRFDGTVIDPGSASDGEEWFATALLFAARRWEKPGQPRRAAPFNYGEQAQALLNAMLHKAGSEEVTPIFNRAQRQIVFAPNPTASRFTDPSYHVPAFYQLWAQWADNPSDRRLWAQVADISRAFLRAAADRNTGLMPEYAHFDGRPHRDFEATKGDFRYDAWRTLQNVALDHVWWGADPWQVEQSNRVLGFLRGQPTPLPNQYSLDGKPLASQSSLGLVAMAAVAGQAADAGLARPFVQQLWDAPVPTGKWRYYDGLLYFLALLQTSGRFQSFAAPPP